MKYIIFLFMLPFAAFAQTSSYRIDEIKTGGYYLVRTEIDTAKGTRNEFPQKFNTREQITAYVGYLREQAADNAAKAVKTKQDGAAEAKRIMDKADAESKKQADAVPILTDAATKVEEASAAFFDPKPAPPPAPANPPKKADKKKKQ